MNEIMGEGELRSDRMKGLEEGVKEMRCNLLFDKMDRRGEAVLEEEEGEGEQYWWKEREREKKEGER